MSVALELPELTPDEAAHSERLAERVRAEIARAGGWISFARFMEMALYEPGLGYYSAGARKLGAAGDFVTAPEVAPVFSRCLAVQCAEILHGLGGGEVLELGAGIRRHGRRDAGRARTAWTLCRPATGSWTSAPTCVNDSARRWRRPCRSGSIASNGSTGCPSGSAA